MTSKAAKAKGAERKQRMDTSSLMEQILSKDNLKAVYLQVVRNKGAAGVDGMAVEELGAYLSENGENIREQLRTRKYKLQPVRRVEILVHMPLFNVGNLLYRYMAQIRKLLLCQAFSFSGFPHFCPKVVKSSIGIIIHLKYIVSC